MLAPVNDPKLATLLHRLHSAVDIPAFFEAVKAILHEAMPGQRNLTAQDKALLRALSPHVEATARKLNSTQVALDTQALARGVLRVRLPTRESSGRRLSAHA